MGGAGARPRPFWSFEEGRGGKVDMGPDARWYVVWKEKPTAATARSRGRKDNRYCVNIHGYHVQTSAATTPPRRTRPNLARLIAQDWLLA